MFIFVFNLFMARGAYPVRPEVKSADIGVGMEEAEPDTMNRPPRNSKEGIFAGGLFFDIAYQGILVIPIVELVKLIQRKLGK